MQKNNAYEQFFDVVEVLQAISEWESKKDALAKVWKSRSWLNDLDRRWTLNVKKALEIAEEYGENYLENKIQNECMLEEVESPEIEKEKRYAHSEAYKDWKRFEVSEDIENLITLSQEWYKQELKDMKTMYENDNRDAEKVFFVWYVAAAMLWSLMGAILVCI